MPSAAVAATAVPPGIHARRGTPGNPPNPALDARRGPSEAFSAPEPGEYGLASRMAASAGFSAYAGSVRGSPKWESSAAPPKRVTCAICLPSSVSTSTPTPRTIPDCGSGT